VIAIGLALVYRYGPSRAQPQWRWISWGSAFAAIAWVAVSVAFSWYAANFDSYNKTYGSLGAIVVFMFWIWLSVSVILIGAELDSEMEHQTVRETTTGGGKPVGARGAYGGYRRRGARLRRAIRSNVVRCCQLALAAMNHSRAIRPARASAQQP